jgi:hypothetical protein
MDISIIINKLSNYEKKDNLEIIKNFSKFEKRIYKEIKQYDDKSGLNDYRMNIYDYYILLILYENSNKYKNKLELLLYYIYSYYKLDGIEFNKKKFPMKNFFNFLKENEIIHKLILNLLITIK